MKKAPAPKTIYQITLWLADTGNGVRARSVCVGGCVYVCVCVCMCVYVCVFPLKCCQCDTFITGDINELNSSCGRAQGEKNGC